MPNSKTDQFFHPPWMMDRESAQRLVPIMKNLSSSCQSLPDNSPDVFFGYACQEAGIHVEKTFELFTRNSLDLPGDLEMAVEAARNGVDVIHGAKKEHETAAILAACS